MLRLASLTVLLAGLLTTPCLAQWPSWADRAFGDRPSWRSELEPQARPQPLERLPSAPLVADGGVRPEIQPQAPEMISFPHDYLVASVVISTAIRKLYYILPDKQAYAYAISARPEPGAATNASCARRVHAA